VVAHEHVGGVVGRLGRPQARPGGRIEEGAGVRRLLDEVEVVAGAIRLQGGVDVGEGRVHCLAHRLVEDRAQREHADVTHQRGARAGAGRGAGQRATHLAQLQHRDGRAAPGLGARGGQQGVDRLRGQPIEQRRGALEGHRVERVHGQVAEHDGWHHGERVPLRAELAQRPQQRGALGGASEEGGHHDRVRAPAREGRHVGDGREVQQRGPRHELVRELVPHGVPGVQHLVGALESEEVRAGVQLVDLDDAELDGGHDAEVPAAAAQCPEQLGLVLGVDADQLAVGGDELEGRDGVGLQPVLAREPAHAATERVAGDADVGRRAVQPGQAVGRQARRDAVPLDAGADAHASGARIDADLLQAADVDEEQIVHVAQRRLVVGRRLRRDAQPEALGERDGVGDLAGVGRERDRGWPLVDEQIERRARLVVEGIVGEHDGAGERVGEEGGRGGGEHGGDARLARRRGRSLEDG
jgi:hypothetical protein